MGTGDILDNKQEYLHAFAMVREAIAWLDRTLPLSARFPKGAINREDRLPVPAEALREIVINAVIHRDVSTPSSYVAIAVFDDRIEVRSIGDFPSGVRAEQLASEHLSVRRNPLIAEAQVDVGQKRADDTPLWRSFLRLVRAAVLHDACLQLLHQQPHQTSVRDAVLDELLHPPMVDGVEEVADVRVEHPGRSFLPDDVRESEPEATARSATGAPPCSCLTTSTAPPKRRVAVVPTPASNNRAALQLKMMTATCDRPG